MCKAENQESKFAYTFTKTITDKHCYWFFRGWQSQGRFIDQTCLACLINAAELLAIHGNIIALCGSICRPFVASDKGCCPLVFCILILSVDNHFQIRFNVLINCLLQHRFHRQMVRALRDESLILPTEHLLHCFTTIVCILFCFFSNK